MNAYTPKISVVTPSYNQGKFLEKTILSVINQAYPNLEYIVIDGGSIDDSVDIIRKYEKYITYWISEKDKGQADALRKGFEKSTGDILCWINSDDTYEDHTFEKISRWFAQLQGSFILTGYSRFRTERKIIWEAPNVVNPNIKVTNCQANQLLRCWKYSLAQPSTFWSREAFIKLGNIHGDYFFAMDLEYWLRAIKLKIPIYFVPETFSNFLYHETSKSVSSEEKLWKDLESLSDKYLESPNEKASFLKDLEIYKKSFFLIRKSNELATTDKNISIKLLLRGIFNHIPSLYHNHALIRNTILKLLGIKS